jgi:hypothetical protein
VGGLYPANTRVNCGSIVEKRRCRERCRYWTSLVLHLGSHEIYPILSRLTRNVYAPKDHNSLKDPIGTDLTLLDAFHGLALHVLLIERFCNSESHFWIRSRGKREFRACWPSIWAFCSWILVPESSFLRFCPRSWCNRPQPL